MGLTAAQSIAAVELRVDRPPNETPTPALTAWMHKVNETARSTGVQTTDDVQEFREVAGYFPDPPPVVATDAG